ncbi:MAG: peptide-methionine (S)-S-oxide reductase MsrA [Rhodospirillales bacterium]|nr:peptide-methionine (S)-S-oxide reductase MsrA [Rhodospirillales bacterium]
MALATLGGGCFWCLEAIYLGLRGVTGVKSGYAGGTVANPTYREVCGHTTGHAEVVQITFDPQDVTYEDLLRVFFTIHDPTTKDRQGNDVGPQYRSIILAHDAAQEQAARAVIAEVAAAQIWPAPIVTEVVRLEQFWPAEREHDDYFARNPQNPYCQAVVAPKVLKFRKHFAERLKARAA